jgi:hypothetical protein
VQNFSLDRGCVGFQRGSSKPWYYSKISAVNRGFIGIFFAWVAEGVQKETGARKNNFQHYLMMYGEMTGHAKRKKGILQLLNETVISKITKSVLEGNSKLDF